MWSYWEQAHFIGEPDLVVVGSGIVGLNAALHFRSLNPHSDVLVLEAGTLPSGASTKNAGFACYGSPSEVLMDLEHLSEERVLATMEKRWKGLLALREALGDKGIGYEEPGSFELYLSADRERFSQCSDQLKYLNDLIEPVLGHTPYSIDSEIVANSGFSGISGAIRNHGEGQINTGLMMRSLVDKCVESGVRILNGLKVLEIEEELSALSIHTDAGTLRTQQCLVATNGFAAQLVPELEVAPARAQVLITNPIADLPFQGTYHFDSGYYYFRNVGDRVLFGGGRNLDPEGETTSEQVLNTQIHERLDQLLSEVILPKKDFSVTQRWTGIMGVGQDKLPYVQRLSDRLFCAVKLGGMGVAIGTQTGRDAAELITA